MAKPRHPTEQFPASNFATCGGSILINSTRAPLKICLLRCITRDEWVLPKGHKDRGEDVIQAALRETYEESGYPCQLLPLNVTTLAPAAGQQTPARPALAPRCEEPFMLTLRRYKDTNVKLISWFVTVRTGVDKVNGTQMATESFESAFLGVDEALERATFQTDREVIAAAVELVRATYPEAREIKEQKHPR
ncbi:hypothetical protein BC827DRAFT_1221280 [Russula dissimulans]|jgi:8-oxo-dGTP pyrophosphatase MutT (NUDIX family)|nr:hypothetical protein BC827DRAFT_1221280 [Russula dissimulans]